MFRKKVRLFLECLEDRRLLAGTATQIDTFEMWNGGVIPSSDASGVTYHPPSGHLFASDSEINEIPEISTGDNLFEISLSGNTLHQAYTSNNDEPTGITYNSFDGFFYITNDSSAMRGFARYDSNLNNPLAIVNTTHDVPNAVDPEGIGSNPNDGTLYVIDGQAGGAQVLVYDANLSFQYNFSVASQLTDPEGIVHGCNDLFVLSDADERIVRYTTSGVVIEDYDLSGLSPDPKNMKGMAFAPTSNPLDDPSNIAAYIVDLGVDNFPDGRVYEVVLSGCQTSGNQAPQVDAEADQNILFPAGALLNGTVSDDGMPDPPGVVTTNWSQVSGPPGVVFGDPSAIDTTANFPTQGNYVLRLTADDGLAMAGDNVSINVTDESVVTLDVRVATGPDDAEQRATGSVNLTSSDLEMDAVCLEHRTSCS